MKSPAKLTPYAELLLARAEMPAPSYLASDGDWISTALAAKLTGYSQRNIQRLCDEGFFAQGTDWCQRPPRPGARQGGVIWLRRSALKKFDDAP